ncbi:Hypothetical protein D9617_5g067650 [Elsinoe fawcettii]|nr:Hypothetical protein D9617_5g067650 [Elsinoe fawcettii]
MPYLEEIAYTEADTVSVLQDFYQFIVAMYLDPACVHKPPEDGWDIAGFPAGFDKGDNVLALLRRLPYLEPGTRGAANIVFADWRWLLSTSSTATYLNTITHGDLSQHKIPPSCIGLTTGGRDDATLLLDTDLGIIYWSYQYNDPITNATREQVLDDSEDFADEDEVEWRSETPAWAIADFFEVLKDHFRDLSYVPISSEQVYDVWTEFPDNTGDKLAAVRGIYREYDWPDLGVYRKDECLAAVQEMLERRFSET